MVQTNPQMCFRCGFPEEPMGGVCEYHVWRIYNAMLVTRWEMMVQTYVMPLCKICHEVYSEFTNSSKVAYSYPDSKVYIHGAVCVGTYFYRDNYLTCIQRDPSFALFGDVQQFAIPVANPSETEQLVIELLLKGCHFNFFADTDLPRFFCFRYGLCPLNKNAVAACA